MTNNKDLLKSMRKDMTLRVLASVVNEFKSALSKANSEAEVDTIYNNYKSRLKRSFDPQDWEAMCNARKGKIKQQKSQKVDDTDLDQLAINQAIDHLISAADVLDQRNLRPVANSIDILLRKFSQIFKK
jgi:hypothetical protein